MSIDLPFDQEKTSKLLTALGDPARIEIVFLLGSQGRLNVGDIASNFRISRPAVSHHLKILRETKVLQSEKVGQEVYYWLNYTYLENSLQELMEAVRRCAASQPQP